MASLNHVCMWQDNQWKHITAQEAARIHPGGTVSARSGLFMCELCGQFVLLTDGGAQVRHFRHSSREADKNCPERTFSYDRTYTSVRNGEHNLPIRIILSEMNFSLEIGFIRVPEELISSNLKINIKASDSGNPLFVYSGERLNRGGITYLSIGQQPAAKYSIHIYGDNADELQKYWPKTVQGLDYDRMIFDVETGRKLPYDSDVTIHRKYLLLTRQYIPLQNGASLYIGSIMLKKQLSPWKIYEITAKQFSEETAIFFQKYHCRLTERPVAIQPVWPPYIENPYMIKHDRNSTVLHIAGNAPHMNVFPEAKMQYYPIGENDKVREIFCKSRQQMISAGRAKVLQYTYYWQEKLNSVSGKSGAVVQDLKGRKIESGISSELPYHETLRIKIPYDGIVTRLHENAVMEKQKISADEWCEIYGISWKDQLKIYIGLDCVWQKAYVLPRESKNEQSEKILNQLKIESGEKIHTPHAMRSMAAALKGYPDIQRWALLMIRQGWMYKNSYREIQRFVININRRKG